MVYGLTLIFLPDISGTLCQWPRLGGDREEHRDGGGGKEGGGGGPQRDVPEDLRGRQRRREEGDEQELPGERGHCAQHQLGGDRGRQDRGQASRWHGVEEVLKPVLYTCTVTH